MPDPNRGGDPKGVSYEEISSDVSKKKNLF